MMNFLDPKVDIAFKKIFGSKEHKHLTMNFLNSILNLPQEKLIQSIDLIETEQMPVRLTGKKVYYDIYCINKQNNHFIIEIQLLNQFNFVPRSEYYTARALSSQLDKGKDYLDLLPVIFIGIVDFHLFDAEESNNDVISSYSIYNDKNLKKRRNSLMQFYYIELPKFTKTLDELETVADRWIYFFKNAHTLQTVPEPLSELQEAFTILDQLQWSNLDLDEYSEEQEMIDQQRRQQEGSFEEGKAEGKEEVRFDIACQLLKTNMNIDQIAITTGLSVDQIKTLCNKK